MFSQVAYQWLTERLEVVVLQGKSGSVACGNADGAFCSEEMSTVQKPYSRVGLVFVMEFCDWTYDEAVALYPFKVYMQYAFNREPLPQNALHARTLSNYAGRHRF